MSKTYEAVESRTLGMGRRVSVSCEDRDVAVFYPQAFADGVWVGFLGVLAKRGDTLMITDINGKRECLAGPLEVLLKDGD